MKIRYRFRTLDGKIVAEGTIEECAVQMGMSASNVKHKIYNPSDHDYLTVEEVGSCVEKQRDSKFVTAAKQWDDFITPIREKYGVKKYRG